MINDKLWKTGLAWIPFIKFYTIIMVVFIILSLSFFNITNYNKFFLGAFLILIYLFGLGVIKTKFTKNLIESLEKTSNRR